MAQLKNTIIRGGLSILGETRLNDTLILNGDLTHLGSTVMDGNLTVNGATTTVKTLSASTGAFSSNVTVSGTLTSSGNLTVNGATTTVKALSASTGDFSSNVTVSGTLTSSGNLTVNGATTTVKALNVTGTLGVSGAATFSSNVTINGNLTVNGTNTVIDTTTLSTKDLLIELGKGNTAALTNYAGFYVTKYDGTNSGAMIIDKNGNFYVGDVTVSNGLISSTTNVHPIAIRGTTIENALTYWNSDKELICNNNITVSGNGIIAQQFYGQATSAASANYAGMEFDTYSGNATYSVPIITGSSLANTKKALAIAAKGITINPSTGVVSAATFSGTFSGNATSATTAQTATSATSATTATYATRLGSSSAYFTYDHVLPKITYEYNKEINFGGDSTLCCLIGEFPMYDSGVVVDINCVASDTYHGILVLRTQNAKSTQTGSYTITVYGDANNTITDALYIYRVPNSNVYKIYFRPAIYSKNAIHIKVLSPNTTAGYGDVAPGGIKNICTSVTFDSSLTYLRPTNALKTYLKTSAAISSDKIVTTATSSNSSYYIPFVSGSTTASASLYVGNSKAFTFNPSTGVVTATKFSGAFSGNATTATQAVSLGTNAGSSTLPVYFSGGKPVATSTTLGVSITGNAATATKSTQIAITGKNTGVYNLGLISSSTTTTTGAIYGSSTNALTYDTSLSQLNIKNAGIQYNSTDECIEFIIS